jgi:hypothetical protein
MEVALSTISNVRGKTSDLDKKNLTRLGSELKGIEKRGELC